MTDNLPPPPVRSDMDLRDFPFTPLFRARLFGSSFHARSTDAEWRAGVTLWLKSWDQTPPGSLPDDDIELCRLAELGRDMKSWKKIKSGALRGWYMCSDGNLYHKVVAEGINEAIDGKLRQRWKTECARIKKANQRNGTDLPVPDYKEWLSLGTNQNVPEDSSEMSPRTKPTCPESVHREMASKRKGKGKGKGQRQEEKENSRKPSELVAESEPDGTASASGLFDRFGQLLDEHFPDRQRQAFEVQPKYIGEGIDICASWLKAGIPPDFIEAEFARIMAAQSAKGAKVQGIRYFRDAIPESWERAKAEAGGPVASPMPTDLADARRTLLLAKRDDEFKEIGRIFEAEGAGPAMAKAREYLGRQQGAPQQIVNPKEMAA